jgi:hypothetical protein
MMEDTGIKLDCVASDLLGKSGRAMLDALVSGTTDPNVLADLARGVLRKKLPALREALEGRFDAEHALVVGQILAHIDFLDAAIARLSDAIEQQIAPLAPAVELLCTIPGVERRAAEVLIAETGGDVTAFPTAAHLASWAGVCPGNNESAGKRRSGRSRQGSKWLRGTLIEAARAAARTRDTYLNAQYRRVRARRGANRASLAVAHALLVAVWRMLQTGEIDLDPGGDCYARRDRPAPPDGSSPGTSASVTQSRRKKRRGRPGADLLLTDDERQRIVSSKRGVAGSNPGVAALQAALAAVAPMRFHARGEPVAWRGIEPKRVPRFSEAGEVAQAERLDHGSTGNGCGLVSRHWITDSRCPRWSPVMGSSENAPKKVVVSSRRAA